MVKHLYFASQGGDLLDLCLVMLCPALLLLKAFFLCRPPLPKQALFPLGLLQAERALVFAVPLGLFVFLMFRLLLNGQQSSNNFLLALQLLAQHVFQSLPGLAALHGVFFFTLRPFLIKAAYFLLPGLKLLGMRPLPFGVLALHRFDLLPMHAGLICRVPCSLQLHGQQLRANFLLTFDTVLLLVLKILLPGL